MFYRFTITVLLSSLLFLNTKSQNKELTVSYGQLQNFTENWLVDQWESNYHLKFRYFEQQGLFVYGAGLGFDDYNISWSKYYQNSKSKFTIISPFLSAGFQLCTNNFTFRPSIAFGYGLINHSIENYYGDDGGLFLAPNMDVNFKLMQGFSVGINIATNFTFSKFQVLNENIDIPQNIIPVEDDIQKSCTGGISLIYSFQ